MKQEILTELQEQSQVVEYLDYLSGQGKVKIFSAVPNNVWTKSWSQLRKQKVQGVRPGVPDLIIVMDEVVLFLEMKRVSGGKIGDNQKIWLEALEGKKVVSRVAKGFDEAKKIIDEQVVK